MNERIGYQNVRLRFTAVSARTLHIVDLIKDDDHRLSIQNDS